MFESIDRIAIAVKDLDKAVGFFSDLLDIDFSSLTCWISIFTFFPRKKGWE